MTPRFLNLWKSGVNTSPSAGYTARWVSLRVPNDPSSVAAGVCQKTSDEQKPATTPETLLGLRGIMWVKCDGEMV